MANYWIKMYMEILDDPKMATLPDRLWRRTIELFLAAGRVDKDGELPDTGQIAWMLRMNTDDLAMDLRQIEGIGVISRTPTGWVVNHFAKRQEAIGGAERVKAHRDRVKRNQYHGSNANDNVPVTKRYTEEDTDKDKEKEEDSSSSDLFFTVQAWMEEITGLPATGQPSIEAIKQIAAMSASREDIANAYEWYRQNTGKPLKYYGSLVNSIRTEQAKRVANKTKFSNVEGWGL